MDARLNIRKRLRDDFNYYSPVALKIRTKDGTIEPLKLNKAQRLCQDIIERQLRESGMVRIIILKARQLGLSTLISAEMYFQVSQKRGQKAMQIAHKAESTSALFAMTQRFHENVPKQLKPSTKYSTRRELSFDLLDSSYVVATAGGDGIGRSETLTHLHASELAFWPAASSRENWNGLSQCVPGKPGTFIAVESTANGVSGLFYELCQGAIKGENGFELVFIPWYMDDGYRDTPSQPLEHSPDELSLIERFGLDDAQLNWRRKKIGQNGLDLFKQEYPSTPEEAFLTTGRPVFNPDQLVQLQASAPNAIRRMALENKEWVDHPRGELFIFEELDRKKTYVIGADVGGGVRGDPSVAQVLDTKGRQVAVWRGQVHPDFYGSTLAELGAMYNYALICVESNNHGILTNYILAKDCNYPHVWQDTIFDSISDKETVRLGFSTTVKSKPMVIDKLRGAMRENRLTLHDKETLEEMKTFVVTEGGKMEAEAGCHDDHVISLALANLMVEESRSAVVVTDAHYEEGI